MAIVDLSPNLEATITGDLEEYLARVTAAGLTGEMVVIHGVPFQQILDTARARQVDLIILGTHGRTGLAHVLLGSVAGKGGPSGTVPCADRPLPCPGAVAQEA